MGGSRCFCWRRCGMRIFVLSDLARWPRTARDGRGCGCLNGPPDMHPAIDITDWHFTDRCHDKKFLLKAERDRRCYLDWIFKAKKRLGLVRSLLRDHLNSVHLLVKERVSEVIAAECA